MVERENKKDIMCKCKKCHFYNKEKDYCIEKCKENCSKIEFSNCDKFLVNEKLVMF